MPPARDRFLVILMLETGLRIGEALGLRRCDMHLLPDSRSLGCAVAGAHVHVRHRANPNGALAKSLFPRTVPASGAVLASYADYQYERARSGCGDRTEMVVVNLYHEPLGAAMTYRAAKGLFDRLARGAGSRSARTCCGIPQPRTGSGQARTSMWCRHC